MYTRHRKSWKQEGKFYGKLSSYQKARENANGYVMFWHLLFPLYYNEKVSQFSQPTRVCARPCKERKNNFKALTRFILFTNNKVVINTKKSV